MKNYGVDLNREELEQSEEDWIFGGIPMACLTDNLLNVGRMEYLPIGEIQKGKEDMMDCATRAAMNVIETKLNSLLQNNLLPHEQWFRDNKYIILKQNKLGQNYETIELSDAFVAINSGTTKQGNSLKAPIEAARKRGVIPKAMLPLEKSMTWQDYHNPNRITADMYILGQQFLTKIAINYEKISSSTFKEANLRDLMSVAGHAWPEPKNGEYPRTEAQPNHAWMNIQPEYLAFDNYIDTVDGDFIKKLDKQFLFYNHGYRIILSLGKKGNWWDFISNLFTLLWK